MPAPRTESSQDGRRARRERNRVAVLDAVVDLLRERQAPPAVEAVAARAGVSVSSVFRYFDDLDDLHEQAIARYFERFAALFEVPAAAGAGRDGRIAALVEARLDLYEAIAPIARMARSRAADQPRFATGLEQIRRTFADQVGRHFAPDLTGVGRADAADRVALIDALTAFEAWDLLRGAHGRSRRLIARAWTAGIAALLTGA